MTWKTVWKWRGYHKSSGDAYWSRRDLAVLAAQRALELNDPFDVYQEGWEDVEPKQKLEHRIVSFWMPGAPGPHDAVRYKGWDCEVEYREVPE